MAGELEDHGSVDSFGTVPQNMLGNSDLRVCYGMWHPHPSQKLVTQSVSENLRPKNKIKPKSEQLDGGRIVATLVIIIPILGF